MKHNPANKQMPNFSTIFNFSLKMIQDIINVEKFKHLSFSTLELYPKPLDFINSKMAKLNNNYSQQKPAGLPINYNVALPLNTLSKDLTGIVAPLTENIFCSFLEQKINLSRLATPPFTLQSKPLQSVYQVFQNLTTVNLAKIPAIYAPKLQGVNTPALLTGMKIPLPNNNVLKQYLPTTIQKNFLHVFNNQSLPKRVNQNWELLLCETNILHNKTLTSLEMLRNLNKPNLPQSVLDKLASATNRLSINYNPKQTFTYFTRLWHTINKLPTLHSNPVMFGRKALSVSSQELTSTTELPCKVVPSYQLIKDLQPLPQNVLSVNPNNYKLITQNVKLKDVKVILNHKFNKLLTKYYHITTPFIKTKASSFIPNLLPIFDNKFFVTLPLQLLSKKIYKYFSKLVPYSFATLVRLNHSLKNIIDFHKNINLKLWELPTTKAVNMSAHYNHSKTTKIINNANVTVYNNGKQSVANDIVEATNKSFQQMRLASTYGK
ncbi:putative phage protein [Candidatus Hepatincola sp. Pdp]